MVLLMSPFMAQSEKWGANKNKKRLQNICKHLIFNLLFLLDLNQGPSD